MADKNKKNNRAKVDRLVMATIRQCAPVPRIDIVAATGLSPATITTSTASLIARGLIEEVSNSATPATGRGRPRVDLRIRGAAHLVMGIKLSSTAATVTIMDFNGQIAHTYSAEAAAEVKNQLQTIAFLRQVMGDALQAANLQLCDISGLGIGIPGVVDISAGRVLWSPMLESPNIPLQKTLSETFNMPVFLENDANLVAVAEQRFGLGRKAQNFIVISVEQGVGMGVVIGGKIYRGARGAGAELGHTKVHLDGAICRCGQRGCLEAYVSDYALLREAGTAMDLDASATTEAQMQTLFAEATGGNILAQSILRRARRMFAMGVANVVNFFAPEMIILSGDRAHFDYLYTDEMITEMNSLIVQTGGCPPAVHIQNWGHRMWAQGAAAYAIDGVTKIALSVKG